MPLFGTIAVWTTLVAVACSIGLYLFGGKNAVRWGRVAFWVAAGGIFAAAATLGDLLVMHRFDVAYVYQHSARAMAPLYWFPSFWSGQEGSFLLWAFWISVLGMILTRTAGSAERRVMPIYASLLLFLAIMLAARSPFIMLDTQGQPVPTEGLGLNPLLENYWMVIHPPTLFLGFSAMTVPFAFALAGLLGRDWDGWLRRALPWSLFGFAVLGLAMMMGGYWAYEMLGWGGFWEWDPVENGPFVPWIALVAFLHAAQIQRVRGGFQKPTLALALLPFIGVMYESFMTRSGVLKDFSVHSFSELGGIANNLLLWGLLLAVAMSVSVFAWRARELKDGQSTLDVADSREFGYTMATLLLLVAGIIACVGLSAPLITGFAVKMGWMAHTASVKEDFYDKAMFPLAVLLAIGLGVGPWLAWRGEGKANGNRLGLFYLLAVVATIGFVVAERIWGTPLTGARLVPELILFAASVFALIANGTLLVQKLRPQGLSPNEGPHPALSQRSGRGFPKKEKTFLNPLPSEERAALGEGRVRASSGMRPVWTIGGLVSHLGAALFLLGLVCLVTFVQRDKDRLLVKNLPTSVLNGAYEVTYLGQTGDYRTDRNDLLQFRITPKNGHHSFLTTMPFALRTMEGGGRQLVAHPSISHHLGGDLYLALNRGPDEFYVRGRTPITIPLGSAQTWGQYTLQFLKFERDPQAAAFVKATHQMPARFPVWADLRVIYHGKSYLVQPQSITLQSDPSEPSSPEVTLPGGALLSFVSMSAGSLAVTDPNAGTMSENGSFVLREPGPVVESFEIDATTRPMINFIWLGTLLIFFGGLLSMRRRILENRAVPVPDFPVPTRPASETKTERRRAKRRSSVGHKPIPSLISLKGKEL